MMDALKTTAPQLLPIFADLLPVVLVAIAGYLARAAKRWLEAKTHSTTLSVIADAMGRAGALAANDYVSGKLDARQAAAQMAGYLKQNMPDTLKKIGATDAGLQEMAAAVLAQTLGGQRPAAQAK